MEGSTSGSGSGERRFRRRPTEQSASAPTPTSAADLLQGARTRELRRLPNSALVDLDYEQDIKLKKLYARAVLLGLGAQLVAADVVFVLYAAWGVNWDIQASVIQVWLGATVVEIIGVVLVVTRYLFPRRDHRPPS